MSHILGDSCIFTWQEIIGPPTLLVGRGLKFLLPPPRAIGVADSGAAVVFSVSSVAARVSLAPSRGEGLIPPTLEVVGERFGSLWWKDTGNNT